MPTHLSDAERWKIVYLCNDLHLSLRQIAKTMKCSHKAVEDTIHRYRETGSIRERQHPGRPSSMNEQSLKRLDRIISKHTSYTSSALAREMHDKTGIRISPRTIRRVRRTTLARHPVHEQIVKSLKPGEITRRLSFANKHVNDNFHHILFSDEKLFVLSNTGTVHWIKKGEPIPTREIDDFKASILIWGCIWWWCISYASSVG
jgi:transposase